MPVFFMDTSAIVKRYLNETGSEWVRQTCTEHDAETGEQLHTILIAEIAYVEVAAAIAKRTMRTKEISETEGKDAYRLFIEHSENEYELVPLTFTRIRPAADLALKYALRAYDAVQLSLAFHANELLKENNLSLTFIASDKTLLQAAQAEGLAVENPSDHLD
ncbi:MAG: type II toxin-antitoxin system VapC family toxin [Chloroflexi bacterium]|nr:type II toxin-antitoxin system VapC family toxin [Chloroflexota bacterium]